ncbi:hypothetical protein VTN02DRAFT_3352 [Thermoascus thermophilus]
MVLLVTTPTMLAALETLPPARREALSLPTEPAVGAPISHEQLIRLGRYFREGRSTKQKQKARVVEGRTDKTESDEVDDCDECEDEHEHEHEDQHEHEHEHDKNKDEDVDEDENEDETTEYTLNTLLRGTRVYVPPPPPKPQPSPEYLALKARLQAAAEADAYNRLLSSTSSPSSSSFPTTKTTTTTPGPEPIFASSSPHTAALHDLTNPDGGLDPDGKDNDPLTPSVVLNIFLSVLLTGFSTFWALSHFQTSSSYSYFFSPSSGGKDPVSARVGVGVGVGAASEPVRVLLALLAALLVGVAEVVVYAAYLRKVADARAREGRVRERKVVIGPVPDLDPGQESKSDGDGDDGDGRDEDEDARGPTEEIWGRGVNGGVRRRVRERWDREREREQEQKGSGKGEGKIEEEKEKDK